MSEVPLSKFISSTLSQIIEGIINAQEENYVKRAKINPPLKLIGPPGGNLMVDENTKEYVQRIDFDVATTITTDKTTSGGIGICIAPLGAGVKGKTEKSDSCINRIRFSIPVVLPLQKQEDSKR